VLREKGIDVDAAENLNDARVLFQAGRYDLVLLDLHRYPPAEALVFCRVIKSIDPSQRIALLVGAPSYVTLDWRKELAGVGDPSRHLHRKAKRHTAAA
jgi:DNA-binding response OmpR family regulator